MTLKDNRSSVTVPMDEELVVRLPDNPSTGYAWFLTTAQDFFEVTSSQFTPFASMESGIAGGGGNVMLSLRPLKVGVCRLEMRQARPWDRDEVSPNGMIFSLAVVVE